MKRQIVALILLAILLLPMLAGISRIKRLPRGKSEDDGQHEDRDA